MADKALCSIPGCGKPRKSLGLCGKHYQSSPHLGVRLRGERGKHAACTYPGCGKPHEARGLCVQHLYHWNRANKPDQQRKRTADGQLLAFVALAISATTRECIIWPPIRHRNAYLQIKLNGCVTVAHRYVCEMAHGRPTDPALLACHSCNRRNCINPNHLRWDTNQSNMADKILHGTQQIGAKNPASLLTEEQAKLVKYDTSKTSAEWATHFGVSPATISHIRTGRNWKHV